MLGLAIVGQGLLGLALVNYRVLTIIMVYILQWVIAVMVLQWHLI